jgi:hypothetical protein
VSACAEPARLRYWGTTDAADSVPVIGGSIMTPRRSGNRLAALPGVVADHAADLPVLSAQPGQFLLKDQVLVGVAIWTLDDSLRGARARASVMRCVPSRSAFALALDRSAPPTVPEPCWALAVHDHQGVPPYGYRIRHKDEKNASAISMRILQTRR